MRPSLYLCSAIAALLPLCACAPYSNPVDTRYVDNTPRSHHRAPQYRANEGRVSGIERLSAQSNGGGAILGAVVGGVLGNQVGRGDGRKAATGVGAIGGAIVGNQLAKDAAAGRGVYRITVDFSDGRREAFDYDSAGDLRIGDPVRVDGGQITRL